MSFFSELKRRNVIRLAIAYVAISWLLIQVVETLFPIYGLSDTAIRMVVAILAVGFVPALVIAWVFETDILNLWEKVMKLRYLAILIALLATFSPPAVADQEEGMASYYADSLDGNPTASGEPYDKNAFTAAHRTLPFGTMVKVTNLENSSTVVVRINDRGPHVKTRIIDVSGAAAEKLDLVDSGTVRVQIELEN